jgi:hypothetical protein
LLYKYHSQVKVDFLRIIDEKTNLMKLNLNKFFNNKILSIEENHKFLDGIYTTRMKESISYIKFIIQKFNTDNPYDNDNNNDNNKSNYIDFLGEKILLSDQQRQNLIDNLNTNFIKIGKFAKKFDDEFLENLSEIIVEKKTKKIDKNNNKNTETNLINKDLLGDYVSKQELIKHFNDNKEDIFFELFYNYDVFYNESEKTQKNLLRFLVSTFLSEFSNIWLEYFNPLFNVTNPESKDFINQFKAVNYIYYNIKNENYSKAYSNLEYIHPSNIFINKLKLPLEKLSKTQIFCEIMEAHVEGTQKYKDEIKANLQLL